MRKEIKNLNYNIHNGTYRINYKLINEPINNLIGTCNHSDCKTKCGEHCFEIEIDTTHPINTFPVLQPEENSRESQDSILSNVTLIVERTNEQKWKYNYI